MSGIRSIPIMVCLAISLLLSSTRAFTGGDSTSRWSAPSDYTMLWDDNPYAGCSRLYSGARFDDRFRVDTGPGNHGATFGSTTTLVGTQVALQPDSPPPSQPTPRPTSTPISEPITFGHEFIVMEENTGYSSVVGNTAEMPYLNSLITKYALATNYYANTHPSLPNYLWITSGAGDGVTTDTCSGGGNPIGPVVSNDNIIRHLIANGISWRTYQEDLPSEGYMDCGPNSIYDPDHNPFRDYTDVQDSPAQQQNIVPLTQFASDLQAGTFARYNLISPNIFHDGHSSTLAQVDQWLQTNIAPLLTTPMFKPGGDGLLIITFDEGDLSDNTNGGGQIAWVIIGPKVKTGYQSAMFYQHQSTLRLMMQGLGLKSFPQQAANAPDMTEFFNVTTSSPTPTSTRTAPYTRTPTLTAVPAPTPTATPRPKRKRHGADQPRHK